MTEIPEGCTANLHGQQSWEVRLYVPGRIGDVLQVYGMDCFHEAARSAAFLLGNTAEVAGTLADLLGYCVSPDTDDTTLRQVVTHASLDRTTHTCYCTDFEVITQTIRMRQHGQPRSHLPDE